MNVILLRRSLKFLHTLGSAGLIGAAAALAAVAMASMTMAGGAGHATTAQTMARIAVWIVGPSVVPTVITDLLAMWATPAFQDAGWVWVKAATGILVLLGGLHVIGPIQDAAKRSAAAPANSVAHTFGAEINTIWVLLAVSAVNIALGVWRPRMPKYPV